MVIGSSWIRKQDVWKKISKLWTNGVNDSVIISPSLDYDSLPLNAEKAEIRLLKIHPRENISHSTPLPSQSLAARAEGSPHSTSVKCSIYNASLNDNLLCAALSYTWGPDKDLQIIQTNGQDVAVRPNLEAAFRQIQDGIHPIILWVDAVCINQNDDNEKSRQVQLMRTIYEKALSVYAWLGPAKDDSDAAMDYLDSVRVRAIQAGILEFRPYHLSNWSNPDKNEPLDSLKQNLNGLAEKYSVGIFHSAVKPLSERPYWTRVWTVQEVSVARDVILICGSKRVHFITFGAALNFSDFARWRLERIVSATQSPGEALVESFTNDSLKPSGAPATLIGARRNYQLLTDPERSLKSFLDRVCNEGPGVHPLNVTDPRDKVYGILGLASKTGQFGIVPNYSKSAEDVYIEVSRALICHGETSVLAWSQQPKHLEGLPSWVPDFSSPIQNPCGEDYTKRSLFSASGRHYMVTVLDHPNPTVLAIGGTRVDSIRSTGSPWMPAIGAPFNYGAAVRLFKEIDAFCKQSQEIGSTIFQNEQLWSEASWRIPCADMEFQDFGSLRATHKTRNTFLELPSSHNHLQYNPYIIGMERQHNRRPFISAEGYVGLAPAHSLPGDAICILYGTSVPFVLRDLSGGRYELIGEAYVHGIMDGEWFEKDRTPQTFLLC